MLLEVAGVIRADKLRVIILLKADFHFSNTLYFEYLTMQRVV